jgi:hypothetical protein
MLDDPIPIVEQAFSLTVKAISKINMPVIEQEFKMGIINTFGMHRNVN